MKNIHFIAVAVAVATSYSCFAQTHPILSRFIVSEINGRAFLSWSIIAGSTCDGIQIYRSVDSANFSRIGEIAGVCGSVSFEEPYDFTDNDPIKNSINYYRLDLGNQGFSQIVSVEIIDIESFGYQIRPHPAITEAKIYFDNSTLKEYQLTIYTINGIEVFSTATKEDFFQLNTSLLQSGLYLFAISISGNLPSVKGKLLVQH
ncbi:MAG: T9SS type A sorting domain-containing protein [Bacteroidetes bacterium]|nr:T9SS type A sorting domain-containing protein [Bacteroidota bacterium]